MLGDPQLAVSNHNQVFTAGKVTKGKLVLLPIGTLQLLPMDKIQKHHCIIRCKDLDKQVFLAQAFKCDFVKETGLFCPHWMVKPGSSVDESPLAKQVFNQSNLHIPALVNKKQVEKHALLQAEPEEEQSSGTKKKSG